MRTVQLADLTVFAVVSGLWKGEREPLQKVRVLRSTDFRRDGLFDYSDVAEVDADARQFSDRKLLPGDIVIERSGGGPKQPVGRVALFQPSDDAPYAAGNFTTTLRVVDRQVFDPDFVALYLHALYLSGATESLQRGATGIRNLDWREYLRFSVPAIPIADQRKIAWLIAGVRTAYRLEEDLVRACSKLQAAVTHALFTRGLRNEPTKDAERDPLPESWEIVPLGALGKVGNGSTPKKSVSAYWANGTFPWLTSAKVYDRDIRAADQFVTEVALKECHLPVVQAGAVLIAITGQGKTLGHCAVLRTPATISQHLAYVQVDPEKALPEFVRGYLETQYESLRQVASGGGSTKGALTCGFLRGLLIPLPSLQEQKEIAEIVDSIEQKIQLHERRKAVLESLFKALLHKLMSGEIHASDLDLSRMQAKVEALPA